MSTHSDNMAHYNVSREAYLKKLEDTFDRMAKQGPVKGLGLTS